MAITFIVGTGRCGSTLLSRILADHPDVLSVSEFFSTLKATAERSSIPAGEITGGELWAMLATPLRVLDAMVTAGLPVPEMCYPYGRGRFSPDSGVPPICHYLLPMISSDPDALFGHLAAEVPGWPRRRAAEQYQSFFGYLADVIRRRIVVERSGGSLAWTALLRGLFPAARFVHVHRNGPDCALSMSRHPPFRVETLLAGSIRATGLRSSSPHQIEAALPAKYKGLISPPFDSDRLMNYPIPVQVFAEQWWTPMILTGLAALDGLVPGNLMTLRYEDLLSHPAQELAQLARFLEIGPEPRWLEAAGRLIDPGRMGRAAAELDPAVLASVQGACAEAERAIKDAGSPR